jgi:hypothetical protein
VSETRFYLCDVCAAEIPPDEPCHRAVETVTPGAYLSSGYMLADATLTNARLDRYVCASCLPLRRYKTRQQRIREAARRDSNVLDMRLSDLFRWISRGGKEA